MSTFCLHKIGFVFQAYNLIPVLSAAENIEFVLRLLGVAADERRERAEAVLREVGLAGMGERRPAYLSGGQQPHGTILDCPGEAVLCSVSSRENGARIMQQASRWRPYPPRALGWSWATVDLIGVWCQEGQKHRGFQPKGCRYSWARLPGHPSYETDRTGSVGAEVRG